jgi:aldose 1-epimerase
MSFMALAEDRIAGGNIHKVFKLSDVACLHWAEVWPSLGCNCLRWHVPGSMELLYVAPEWESNPVPTRSGVPFLFPFPNRIRDGHFTWDGREYQLPINGPNGRHAIHGFACRKPWRVVDSGESTTKAWVTAEFHGSIDAPESLAHWPADYRIMLTVSLEVNQLSFVARIDNPDTNPLPFGLGYHPYFAIQSADECLVSSAARTTWELADNIPTGRTVAPQSDLRTPARFADLHLDDVYTDFGSPSEMYRQGRIEQAGIGAVEIWVSPGFREMVAFTPPHRKAVCLEPYTCTTDAINLQARGIDAGWRVLAPGESVTETVTYRFEPRRGG